MNCDSCGGKTKVVATIKVGNSVVRHRKCKKCGKTKKTTEE